MERESERFLKSQKELLDAISSRDENVFTKISSKDVDFNYYDGLFPQPLVYSMYNYCTTDFFKKLIKMGADVNAQCEFTGMAPIHHSVRLGRLDCLKIIADNGGYLEVEDNIGRNRPLHYAIESGSLDIANFLINRGVEINCYDLDGYTPLLLAAEIGRYDMLELLLKHGANINSKNKFTGQTALHLACVLDNAELALKLIRLGASSKEVDIYGNTAIDAVWKNKNFIFFSIIEKIEQEKSELLDDGDSENIDGKRAG